MFISVYLFAVEKVIYKIGFTRGKGGINSPMNFYQAGLGGSPSLRSFGIHFPNDIQQKHANHILQQKKIRVIFLMKSLNRKILKQLKWIH